jgi:hypothetical protein
MSTPRALPALAAALLFAFGPLPPSAGGPRPAHPARPQGAAPRSVLSPSRLAAVPSGAGTTAPYVDVAQFLNVPFGSHSHWAQPWRGYLETVPATTFLNGVGAVWGGGDLASLAAHGVTRLRIEEGWGNVDFDDPTRLDNAGAFGALLRECQAQGIRPLILLNANSGVPCPTRYTDAVAAAPVRAGDTTITLMDASQVVPGQTGLTDVTGYAACRPVFTAVSGNVVTLAQPSPVADAAGETVPLTTLKYAPFTTAGTAAYNATVGGWNQYALTVARSARAALGTVGAQDGGFDLEVWNELTFGSDFLDAANYGLPPGPDMTSLLVLATASLTRAHRVDFGGAGIGNGFANTPWPAASAMPAAITAIDKHPYQNRLTYPADDTAGTNLNAYAQPDGYVPAYTALFPEFYGTFLDTESLLRDASPFSDGSLPYSGVHGRNVRPGNPCPVWITEYSTGAEQGLTPSQTAKAFLRAYCFYLNKGATQLDWSDTASLTADELGGLAGVTQAMRAGLDPAAPPRPLTLFSVSDLHGHAQFQGDGTPARPPLYDRDVFAFLPFQVNAHRFVIPYYVMTRDVAQDLPAETFTLLLSGLTGAAKVAATDPATGQSVPVTVRSQTGGQLQVDVSATDAVRLLTIDDGSA